MPIRRPNAQMEPDRAGLIAPSAAERGCCPRRQAPAWHWNRLSDQPPGVGGDPSWAVLVPVGIEECRLSGCNLRQRTPVQLPDQVPHQAGLRLAARLELENAFGDSRDGVALVARAQPGQPVKMLPVEREARRCSTQRPGGEYLAQVLRWKQQAWNAPRHRLLDSMQSRGGDQAVAAVQLPKVLIMCQAHQPDTLA